MKIKVKRLKPEAKMPVYAHPGDAGMDVFTLEPYNLKSGERHTFPTGISIQIPEGNVALVKDKSGLASKNGITCLGGVIDAHYRGEYRIVLLNTSSEDYEFKKGDKIAQVIIVPAASATLEEVEELSDTKRGEGGFGSTGK